MKFCKYCGARLDDDARFCTECGGDLTPKHAPAKPVGTPGSEHTASPAPQEKPKASGLPQSVGGRKLWLIAGAVLVVAVVLLVISGGRCDYGSCRNKAVGGSEYCYAHKCALSGCQRSRYSYSNYCYNHYYQYDDDAKQSSVASSDLRITVSGVYTKYSYTYASGTITNNSDTTVSYVKIKGAFQDRSGKTLDTDWTYAVDSSGLEPGESCTWELSVPKNSSITKCSVSILDFDY